MISKYDPVPGEVIQKLTETRITLGLDPKAWSHIISGSCLFSLSRLYQTTFDSLIIIPKIGNVPPKTLLLLCRYVNRIDEYRCLWFLTRKFDGILQFSQSYVVLVVRKAKGLVEEWFAFLYFPVRIIDVTGQYSKHSLIILHM